jgi:hypothetical protein
LSVRAVASQAGFAVLLDMVSPPVGSLRVPLLSSLAYRIGVRQGAAPSGLSRLAPIAAMRAA